MFLRLKNLFFQSSKQVLTIPEEEQNNMENEAEQPSSTSNEEITSSSTDSQSQGTGLRSCEIEAEMKSSFMSYAMSVIVSRALPDIRDGLKPVHRRILYSMHDSGFYFNKPYKKSARIVGDVLGKYHPHGDSSVYEALVRMVQPFSLRYPLVDGQGNFGSMDGDSAAAMRYTEARLAKMSAELLEDIDKKTVDFVPNFDASLTEPTVLPSKLPNLLLNGSSGIAVGMATNIPPHNLNEVCSAIVDVIDNPDIDVSELMQSLPGPDFPTGGIILGKMGIASAYKTGRGIIKVRSKISIEHKKESEVIIVEEIPYQVNKAMLIEQIAELVRDKRITEIRDLRDESDKDGVRIVIELKRGASSEVVLNQLYKHSRLQVSFGINMVALVNGQPKTVGLKTCLEEFIAHRIEIITRRTQFELDKAEKRVHILEGLVIALGRIDEVVKLIKASNSVKEAQEGLMNTFDLTEVQSNAILDMKLQKLTSLETEKIKNERASLLTLIAELQRILASDEVKKGIIKDDLSMLTEKFGDARRSELSDIELDASEIDMEDLIEEHPVVVTVSHGGYVKRIPLDTYRQQNRGGKGIIAANTKDEDFIEHLFVTSSHNYMLLFSDKGKVYWKKVYQIPEGSRQSRGQPIINLINIEQGETITAFVPVKEFTPNNYLVLVTENGTIKKTPLDAFSRPRKGGIIAINLSEDEKLMSALLTDGNKQLLIATKNGMAVKFHEANVRAMGRTSHGVRGIRLKDNDKVIGMIIAEDDKTVLTVTEKGYGKRSKISDYRLVNRGGVGVKNIICSERNGSVIGIKYVEDEDDVMLISKNGIIIRIPCRGISVIGRNTQGVRIMKMKSDDDVVISVAKVIVEDKALEENDEIIENKPELLQQNISSESELSSNEETKKQVPFEDSDIDDDDEHLEEE